MNISLVMSGDRPFARFKILDMKRSEADLGLLQRPTIITKHSILDVVAVLDPPLALNISYMNDC